MNYLFKVLNYKKYNNGTLLQVYIPEDISFKLSKFKSRSDVTGKIEFDDNRQITAKQKKYIYAIIKDIGIHLGYTYSETEQLMVQTFNKIKGYDIPVILGFSVDVASEFISFLIEFCFEFDVQLSEWALNRVDNLDVYFYLCLKYRRCCICGKSNSDLHHWNALGMGINRNTYDDLYLRKICLCRVHHSIAHQMGVKAFADKFKVYGIIYNEKQKKENDYEQSDFNGKINQESRIKTVS